MTDDVFAAASEEALRALSEPARAPGIATFFDEATNAASHVIWDRASNTAAVIDSVLDFDPPSGRISTNSADRLIGFLERERLQVAWLIETHVHADHLTALQYLKRRVGGSTAISRKVAGVQQIFAEVFGLGAAAPQGGAGFDCLLDEGDRLPIGGLEAIALATPGHTPADMTFVVGDTAFVGDTIFMPDFGTARADFPGADPAILYRSIRRLLSLPEAVKLRLCHDYKAPGRVDFRWLTTVAEERAGNAHVADGVTEEAFVAMRRARDATLPLPRLFYPSLQVNIRAGRLPDPEPNGSRYFKTPLTGEV